MRQDSPGRRGGGTEAGVSAGDIAQALHDGVAQDLFLIGTIVGARLRAPDVEAPERAELERVAGLTSSAIADVRGAIDALRALAAQADPRAGRVASR